MPGSTTRPRRSRLPWSILVILAALGAVLLFMGSVAANLVATDLDPILKPYRFWVWGVLIGALIVTVVIAVKQVSKPNELTDAQHEPNAQDDTNSRSKPNSGTRPTVVIGKGFAQKLRLDLKILSIADCTCSTYRHVFEFLGKAAATPSSVRLRCSI
ncbi:MAG: hypothetical protein QOJ76_3598 [Acidobacteriota bacterium]|jgi:hypothetical protein|nr:hypothetical protein [Acidobacteriota bacterium]